MAGRSLRRSNDASLIFMRIILREFKCAAVGDKSWREACFARQSAQTHPSVHPVLLDNCIYREQLCGDPTSSWPIRHIVNRQHNMSWYASCPTLPHLCPRVMRMHIFSHDRGLAAVLPMVCSFVNCPPQGDVCRRAMARWLYEVIKLAKCQNPCLGDLSLLSWRIEK